MTSAGEQHGRIASGAPRFAGAVQSVFATLTSLALLACTTGEPTEPCPGEQSPAFVISVSALEAPLPDDLLIRLAYGGGEDEYALSKLDPGPSVMFCSTEAERSAAGAGGSAGAAGAGSTSADEVSRVVCEVWVEGAVTVWVTGGDYAPLEEELSGEANDCGALTVEAELVLGAPFENED